MASDSVSIATVVSPAAPAARRSRSRALAPICWFGVAINRQYYDEITAERDVLRLGAVGLALGLHEPQGLKSWSQWSDEIGAGRDLPSFETNEKRDALAAHAIGWHFMTSQSLFQFISQLEETGESMAGAIGARIGDLKVAVVREPLL